MLLSSHFSRLNKSHLSLLTKIKMQANSVENKMILSLVLNKTFLASLYLMLLLQICDERNINYQATTDLIRMEINGAKVVIFFAKVYKKVVRLPTVRGCSKTKFLGLVDGKEVQKCTKIQMQ